MTPDPDLEKKAQESRDQPQLSAIRSNRAAMLMNPNVAGSVTGGARTA